MEDIIQNPGLQLIVEKSLMCLDNNSISAFRLVNQDCEKIVHSPRFYLKKLFSGKIMKETPKSLIEDWKQLIKKISDQKIKNMLAFELAKMYNNTKRGLPPKHPLELAQDMAMCKENPELVMFIIENSNPKSLVKSKVTGGTQAKVIEGKIALVKSKRCSVNSMHLAVIFGFEEVARRMINNSVPTNVPNEFGVTPIGVAAFHNQLELVQLLMPYYENPNAPCNIGITPIHVAAHNGNTEILKLFLASTDNPNVPENNYGWTPIHAAAQKGHKEIVEVLISSIFIDSFVQEYVSNRYVEI